MSLQQPGQGSSCRGFSSLTESGFAKATVGFCIILPVANRSKLILVKTTAMIFSVLIGALIFSNFINIADLPGALTGWVQAAELSPFMVMMFIILVYVVLGCVLESLSMILLTVPVFYPLILEMNFGPSIPPDMILIWFGIIVVAVTEISLITPPVGLNVFVLRGVLPDVSTGTIFKGVTPFWLADIVRLLILIFLPTVSLLLPGLMGR